MYERVLASKERALVVDVPDTLGVVQNAAAVLLQQDKLDEAKAMCKRALAGKERVLGPDHPETLNTVGLTASVLREEGKLDEAKVMLERVLAGEEVALGSDNLFTLNTACQLANVLRDLGKLDEARAMYERAIAGQERAFGADNPSTLLSLGDRAELLRRAGDAAAAEADQRRTLAGLQTANGDRHRHTLLAVARLALLLAQQGRAAEAAAVYADALQGEPLGPQNPEAVKAIDALSQLLRDGGEAATAAALRERFGCDKRRPSAVAIEETLKGVVPHLYRQPSLDDSKQPLSDDAARWAVEVTPYNEQPTIKSTHLSQAKAEKSAYLRWTREMWPDTPFGLVQQIVDVDKARIYAETSASRRMQLLSKAGGPYRAYDVVKQGSGVIMTVAVVKLPSSSKAAAGCSHEKFSEPVRLS